MAQVDVLVDLVLQDDVGLVIARAVNDPRIANKKTPILANSLAQKDTISIWEELSGKAVARRKCTQNKYRSRLIVRALS